MNLRIRFALACLVAAVVWVAMSVPHAQGPTVNYFSITVDNTSGGVAIGASTLTGMAACMAVLETAEVRYRFDGTAPTSTTGVLHWPTSALTITRIEFWRALRLIRTGSTSATLSGHCWSAT